MAILNKKVSYSVGGFLLIRNNPDGTPVTISRILGFANTVDLSGFGTSAELTLRIDTGAEETNTIDWTTAVDSTAVTVTEMVGFFNTAGFTGVLASEDSVTGRLKLEYTGAGTPNFLQVYDGVDTGFAATLDFGQGIKYGGEGVKYITAFDNTISVGLPLNIKDKEEIETESGRGDYTSIVIEAITKGRNPAITMNDEDFRMKQLIMGGVYNEAENSYTPSTTDQTDKPIFTLDVFHDIYNKGAAQPREDNTGTKRITFYSCTGNDADMELSAKTIANHAFNLTAGEWQDENGVKQAYEKLQNLTIEEYEALDVENL